MKFTTSIFVSVLILAGFFINSYFFSTKETVKKENYLPPARDAVVRKLENNKSSNSFGENYVPYNYGRTKESAMLQAETGQTFPGLDEDSFFVKEIKSKPVAKVYTEYGYIPPDKLMREGDVRGSVMLKRPDGRNVRAVIVAYKGQTYDAEIGFPCYLCGASMRELGLRISYF